MSTATPLPGGIPAPLPTVPTADAGPDATVAEAVRAGLLANVAHFVAHDPVVRLDEDIEGVHQARVGLRRTRSVLRVFEPVLDHGWADPLDAELRRLAGLLGAVRDADVLALRLRRGVDDLPVPADRTAGGVLLERLAHERHQSLAVLLAELESPHYHHFVGVLVAAADRPAFRAGPAGGDGGRLSEQPAAEVLPRLVARPWRKLHKAVRRLPRDEDGHPPVDELHLVRIKAKRARYACDVAQPVLGARARKLSKRIGVVQDVLGDLHDTAVAEAWLRRAGNHIAVPRAGAVVAGQLIQVERREAADLLAAWPGAWAHLQRVRTDWLRDAKG